MAKYQDAGPTAIPNPSYKPKTVLHPGFPNPFNPTTTIAFEVGEAGQVHLGVYDVAGRLVRTLVDDVRQPDLIHRVTWDGHGNDGADLASGLYFYRLTANDAVHTRKVVLLK